MIAAPRCPRKAPDQRICSAARPACEKVKDPRGWNGEREPEIDAGTDAGDGGVRKDCTVLYATSLFSDGNELIVGTPMPMAYKVSTTDDFNETCFTSQLNGDQRTSSDESDDALRLVNLGGTSRLGAVYTSGAYGMHFLWNNQLNTYSSGIKLSPSCFDNGQRIRWAVGPFPASTTPPPTTPPPPIAIASNGNLSIGKDQQIDECGNPTDLYDVGILSNGIKWGSNTLFARSTTEEPFLECTRSGLSVQCTKLSFEGTLSSPPGTAQSAVEMNERIYVLYQEDSVGSIIEWERGVGGSTGWSAKPLIHGIGVSPLMQLVAHQGFIYFGDTSGEIYRVNPLAIEPSPNKVGGGYSGRALSVAIANDSLYWLVGGIDVIDGQDQLISRLYRAPLPQP